MEVMEGEEGFLPEVCVMWWSAFNLVDGTYASINAVVTGLREETDETAALALACFCAEDWFKRLVTFKTPHFGGTKNVPRSLQSKLLLLALLSLLDAVSASTGDTGSSVFSQVAMT